MITPEMFRLPLAVAAICVCAVLLIAYTQKNDGFIPRSIESLVVPYAAQLPRAYPPQFDFTLPRPIVLYPYNIDRLNMSALGRLTGARAPIVI